MVWTVISTLFVGLIIGALARWVVPGKQPMAWWMTMLVGVVGAVAGTAISLAAKISDGNGFNLWELLLQVGIAAVVVVLVSSLGLGAATTGKDDEDN